MLMYWSIASISRYVILQCMSTVFEDVSVKHQKKKRKKVKLENRSEGGSILILESQFILLVAPGASTVGINGAVS